MKYYVDDTNKYIGGTDGEPLSSNEVPYAPNDARQKWNGAGYDEVIVSDAEFNDQVDAELRAIDAESIRSIREYVSAQPDAPQTLKDHEALAVSKRATRK